MQGLRECVGPRVHATLCEANSFAHGSIPVPYSSLSTEGNPPSGFSEYCLGCPVIFLIKKVSVLSSWLLIHVQSILPVLLLSLICAWLYVPLQSHIKSTLKSNTHIGENKISKVAVFQVWWFCLKFCFLLGHTWQCSGPTAAHCLEVNVSGAWTTMLCWGLNHRLMYTLQPFDELCHYLLCSCSVIKFSFCLFV